MMRRKKKLTPAELAQAARDARTAKGRWGDLLLDQLCFKLLGVEGSRLDKLSTLDVLLLDVLGGDGR